MATGRPSRSYGRQRRAEQRAGPGRAGPHPAEHHRDPGCGGNAEGRAGRRPRRRAAADHRRRLPAELPTGPARRRRDRRRVQRPARAVRPGQRPSRQRHHHRLGGRHPRQGPGHRQPERAQAGAGNQRSRCRRPGARRQHHPGGRAPG
ncbi:hypothetical protein G6F35_016046 [Rhizopus arrhizus]|nr:hypothetical protein G6F35_016046 [Rhizopus arrhizus]